MDLRKLQIFQQVADSGSFSQAAAQLHMAQPAVSIAIRKLEQSLGVVLFDRGARQARLTAEGSAVLVRAKTILSEAEELRRSTDALQHLLTGQLELACPSMLATYFLPDLLAEFLQDHPGLQASVNQAGTTAIEELLMNDAVELGVTNRQAERAAELDQITLVSEPIVLCVAANHPWAERDSIGPAELDGVAMVVYESGYYIRTALDRLCAGAGVKPEYRLQSNFLPLLVRMVRQQLGVTVGLGILAQQEPGIVGLAIDGAPRIELALAKRRGRNISRANQAFFDWAAFKLS